MEIVECPWCHLKNELRPDRRVMDYHHCIHCGGRFNFEIHSPEKILVYRIPGGCYLKDSGGCMIDNSYCSNYYCGACKKAIEHENKNMWNIERRKEMGWGYNDEKERVK